MLSAISADLLKRTMGLDAVAIGPSAIARAVRERMTTCMLPDVSDYEARLLASDFELQQLVEAAVVPETWFFRDSKAFAELVRTLPAQSPSANPQRVLRLLSLPCSTGEEPYSMAMALLDARYLPSTFRIDAVDISAHALERARRGEYGRNSFRGTDLEFRERYFRATATGHRLGDSVRELVHFAQGNMLAADFLPQLGIYDAIFCRNLLVYFDRATQTRAIEIIHRLLTIAGVVFVGPAEAGMMFGHDFVWSKVPFAFAFRKSSPAIVPVVRSIQALPRHVERPAAAAAMPAPSRPVRATASAVPPAVALLKAALVPKVRIDEALRFADLGRFVEATAMCEAYMHAHGPSAPAFHLMGLIRNADGDLDEAVREFRKALYLDPTYADSLFHLALLLEKRGDSGGARILRERLQRIERRDVRVVR